MNWFSVSINSIAVDKIILFDSVHNCFYLHTVIEAVYYFLMFFF